jgi:5-methylcytosine-specific restriction endonuclease McrA
MVRTWAELYYTREECLRWTPAERRLALLMTLVREVGGRCCFCLRRLDRWSATKEHIVPRSQGGPNTFANLTASCYACNTARGAEDFYAFEERTPKAPREWAAHHPTRKEQMRVEQLLARLKALEPVLVEGDRYSG